MGICSEVFYKHWNRVTFIAIVPGYAPRGGQNVLKWRTFELTGWITGKWLKIDAYMLRCIWQALNPLSIHVIFTAIFPGAYPGEAKMCLRLSWLSKLPPPTTRVKATTYRRDSPEVAKLWPRLVFMQLTRDLFAIAKFLWIVVQSGYTWALDNPVHCRSISNCIRVFGQCTTILQTCWLPPNLHLASSELWCWYGGREILTELSLCYSIV